MALGGCGERPAPKIASYLSSPAHLLKFRRVAFVQLRDEAAHPTIARDMTEALFRALQERRLFHVEVVRRTDPACSLLPDRLEGRYTLAELAQIRKALRCDAVLFGTVNTFQPYPRMQIGLYLRLLDLKHGRLVWSVDHIWDTRDESTERRVQVYFQEQMRQGYDPVDWHFVTMSPSAFGKFVAYEIADTLPSGLPSAPRGRSAPRPFWARR